MWSWIYHHPVATIIAVHSLPYKLEHSLDNTYFLSHKQNKTKHTFSSWYYCNRIIIRWTGFNLTQNTQKHKYVKYVQKVTTVKQKDLIKYFYWLKTL